MKKVMIKTLAAFCFIGGMGLLMTGADTGSVFAMVSGLSVFSLLIPISKSNVFKEKETWNSKK